MNHLGSFFRGSAADLLATSTDEIIGRLSARLAAEQGQAEHAQIAAWRTQTDLLRQALRTIGPAAEGWQILVEAPMLRLGRRIDVVVLMPGVANVVEFKIGAKGYTSADVAQVEYYALCLRDFHEVARSLTIVPTLCAELANQSDMSSATAPLEDVAPTLLTNGADLAEALVQAAQCGSASDPVVSAEDFDDAPYSPTPTIIEAARALYANHSVADLGRGDAAADELAATAARLQALVQEARAKRQHLICFVTGTPGAGKTLLGLDLALKSRVAGSGLPPASMLSGNPPLVHVLTEALARDAMGRGYKADQARHEAKSAIQGLLGFLRQHGGDRHKPPEHVLVFDEAQRAWDAATGLKLERAWDPVFRAQLQANPRSEPQLFLDVMAKHDWACLVCLVGPGQEINTGEGGLALWGDALRSTRNGGVSWRVVAAPQAVDGGVDISGEPLGEGAGLSIERDPALHLSSAVRAYRNPTQVRWVRSLLDGDLAEAHVLAADMPEPPAWLTRDLETAKDWLRLRRRGGRSVGLLASSGAPRLIAEGIPPAPRSTELSTIAHWFLQPYTDFRSSSALELPMTEFGCQGLELDYVAVAWGGDLLWRSDGWLARRMSAPKWQTAGGERRGFRINGYRVLLTRARAGMLIYVPRGDAHDSTRVPGEFADIAAALVKAGCHELGSCGHTAADVSS